MNNSDAGIPVLTEIIPTPQPGAVAENRHAEPVPEPEVVESTTALEARAASEWDDEKWNRMEREIRARILQQVLERIDFVLEQRVRDNLADVLQTAVEGLADEIKNGLQRTVKDIVTRAIAQEITKLQSSKK